jgi:hypothetical protein
VRTHQDTEVVYDALQYAHSVVQGECVEEVLNDALLVLADVLLELLDDLLLVLDGEGGCAEDLSELGVPLEDGGKLLERLCGAVESVGLGGSGVLFVA